MSKDTFDLPPAKRSKPQLSLRLAPTPYLNAGCQWDSENWSCSYDCMFMSLFVSVLSLPLPRRQLFADTSILAASLVQKYTLLDEKFNPIANDFNQFRDEFRDALSCTDNFNFPRYGCAGASVSGILDAIFQQPNKINDCELPTIINNDLNQPIDLNAYLHGWLNQYHLDLTRCTTSTENISPILTFELLPHQICVHPVLMLTIALNMAYYLTAIIYHGDFHFVARLFHPTKNIAWKYNDQLNQGTPAEDLNFPQNASLSKLDSKSAHVYIYTLI